MSKYQSVKSIFGKEKIFLPVLHVINEEQMNKNLEIIFDTYNADGVFLINNYCSDEDLYDGFITARNNYKNKWIGINYLGDPRYAINMATELEADGIWFDNGGVIDDNCKYAEKLNETMKVAGYKGLNFGGTCFKYQQQPKNISLTVTNACNYMDVVTTSGDGTGKAINLEKLKTIYDASNGNNMIAVASGISPDNVEVIKPYCNIFMANTCISKPKIEIFDEKLVDELINKIRN